MKNFLLTLVAIATCAIANAQAIISFDKTSHNFGTFKEEVVQKTVFTFKNTGNQPLVINQVLTSCGCTASNYTKEPVAPGKTGTIEVTYNGKNKMAGHMTKLITVNSNASKPVSQLKIEGTMVAATKQ